MFWPGELHGLCRPRLSNFQLHSLRPWWVTTSPAATPGAGQRAGLRAGLCVLAPGGAAWVWPASSQGQLPRQPRAPPHPPRAFHLLMIPESLQGLARQETQAPDLGSRGGGAGTRPTPTTPWEGGQAGHSWPRKPQPKRKKDLLKATWQDSNPRNREGPENTSFHLGRTTPTPPPPAVRPWGAAGPEPPEVPSAG